MQRMPWSDGVSGVGTHTLFQKMTLKAAQTMAKATPTMASTVYTANSEMGISRNALSAGGPSAMTGWREEQVNCTRTMPY